MREQRSPKEPVMMAQLQPLVVSTLVRAAAGVMRERKQQQAAATACRQPQAAESTPVPGALSVSELQPVNGAAA